MMSVSTYSKIDDTAMIRSSLCDIAEISQRAHSDHVSSTDSDMRGIGVEGGRREFHG